MTSMATSTTSFHLPQHTQLMDQRILLDSVHSCAPPPPQEKSYLNHQTNETLYYTTEVKVVRIGILFDYEIRHARGVIWEDEADEESSDDKSWAGKAADKAGDFFGNIFGGGDKEDTAETEEAGSGGRSGGGSALLELEQKIADETWLEFLSSSSMSWNADNECTGLIIQKETMRQRGDIDILDGADGADTFYGTKLLGLTYQPLDYVNPNGCTIPDSTCTAIRGQVSVAYSGTDEYSVVQTIIEQLQYGMENGRFIPPNNPALNVEFQGSGGTAAVGGAGKIIPLVTDRGTEEPEEEEDDYLSKYGVLFVCLVAILGAGFIAAMFVRYKKRQKRLKEAGEGVEMTDEEYQANLALQEEEDDAGKTEGDSSRADSPREGEIMTQVELEVPPVDSGMATNDAEIEISLSGSKSYGY